MGDSMQEDETPIIEPDSLECSPTNKTHDGVDIMSNACGSEESPCQIEKEESSAPLFATRLTEEPPSGGSVLVQGSLRFSDDGLGVDTEQVARGFWVTGIHAVPGQDFLRVDDVIVAIADTFLSGLDEDEQYDTFGDHLADGVEESFS